MITATETKKYSGVRNSCKLCSPLGAAMVFRGVRNALPLLHGSQGCSTYIRRYLISHFREPVDISSSNFSESTAVFGGAQNLATAIMNTSSQYSPEVIGIATTCLSETIGDDVSLFVSQLQKSHRGDPLPELVQVSTPSYAGTHMQGFHAAVLALVTHFAKEAKEPNAGQVNIFPGFVSPADIRYIREITDAFGINAIILPDYSDTLDSGPWDEYRPLPAGGTGIEEIRECAASVGSIEFGDGLMRQSKSAGRYLEKNFSVANRAMPLPIGIEASDAFMRALCELSGTDVPERFMSERRRLLDAYADAHKYLFGRKVAIFGDEDLVCALASFICETGAHPMLCLTGDNIGAVTKVCEELSSKYGADIEVRQDSDFASLTEDPKARDIDLFIGNSKGYKSARALGKPLLRVGFPLHDRFGSARIHHIGYRGTQELFDRFVNCILETRQDGSPFGFTYM